MLAGTGTLIGIPLGFIPVAVMVQVGLLVVIVPLVASVAALGASGLALRLRPVTASTMAFD